MMTNNSTICATGEQATTERTGSILAAIQEHRGSIEQFLQRAISIPSVSGHEKAFAEFVAQWARMRGLEVDLFETSEESLCEFSLANQRHIPLAGRPTLVLCLKGRGTGPSIIFNAHSDVVDAPDPAKWTHGAWSGTNINGRIFGRGACDVKGPLAAALLAMLVLRQMHPNGLPGDVLLELVPGEEDCVGLGTLTSIARGYRADAAVILEPTENLPRCASRGGVRFCISVTGRAVHGTMKWLGKDAITGLRIVLDILENMEREFSAEALDNLFANYPLQRPLTVDRVEGLSWQGMLCERALCQGYFELLPNDDLNLWIKHFRESFYREITKKSLDPGTVSLEFPERYNGFRTDPEHPLCRATLKALQATSRSDRWNGWSGFNSGCEAGIRFVLHGTPSLVWGPGTLAVAHATDEYIDASEICDAASAFATLAENWMTLPKVNK